MIKKGDSIIIKVNDLAYGGKGIARWEDEDSSLIIFIQNALPGQKVKAKIVKKKPTYAEARLEEVIETSNIQLPHPYQQIAGAPYISVHITEQKKLKEKVCFEVYNKIGKLDQPTDYYDEWIASPAHHHYRNKMEYSFSSIRYDIEENEVIDDAFALGFKKRGTWWMVENLNKDSGLFDQDLENKMKTIRIWLQKTNLPAWHPPKKVGFFRHLVVRKSYQNDQLLFNLVTSSNHLNEFEIVKFGELLKEIFQSRFAGLIHTINDDVADREKLDKGSSKTILGNNTIEETINGLNFEISMQSFFQTNPKCAEKLYQKVIDYILEENINKNDIILDLFCGTGTIAQLISRSMPENQVIGVDIVSTAIENAKSNAKKNKLNNVQFTCSDVGKFLLNHPEFSNQIHTIVLDPPRAGISAKSLRKIMRLNAKKIIYVSCNPSTQARDLVNLKEMGYDLIKFSLVDQFPHTAHIESIMMFEKQ